MSTNKQSTSHRVARSLHAHLIIALSLGALLYILAITGTISVFNNELQRWEQPSAPEMTAITPEAAAGAAKTVFESETQPTTHLYINFPRPALPRTVVTTDTQAFFINADGGIDSKEHFPWTDFLLDLHYYLHLPHVVGLTIVGILGIFLIAMSISGFMSHPRIFRDAFTFRRGAGLLPMVDLHNRLSVWTSPFHIIVALTGATLGLATLLAFSIASVSFDSDIDKVFDPVFGGEPEVSEEKAPLANIEAPLKYMQQAFPELPKTYFILHDPATSSQHTSVITEHKDRLIFGEYHNFSAEGDYLGHVGISDGTFGQQVIGSIYNVHFGNWGGLLIKAVYGVLGIILCIIIASGLRIYFKRRQQKGNDAPKLAAGWEAIVWGTPALLALTLLCSIIFGLEETSLVLFFWLGLLSTIVAAIAKGDPQRTNHYLKRLTVTFILLTIVSHSIINESSFLLEASYPVTIAFLLVSIALAFSTFKKNRTN